MRFTKPIAAAVAVSLAAFAFAGAAQADDHRHHGGNGGNVAAGTALGFAAGAVVGTTLAQPRYYAPAPVYVAPRPVYVAPRPIYVQPRPVVYRPAPWSPEWYQYCSSRYPSFNPSTGTVWSHGMQKFCR